MTDWTQDPEFMALSPEAKKLVLLKVDQDFAKLSPEAQDLAVSKIPVSDQVPEVNQNARPKGGIESIQEMLQPGKGEGVTTRVMKGVMRPVVGTVTAPIQLAKAAYGAPETEEEKAMSKVADPFGLLTQRMIVNPMRENAKEAVQKYTEGDLRGGAKATIGAIPFVGPWARGLAENLEKGDVAGTVAEGVTTAVLPKLISKVGGKFSEVFEQPPKKALSQGILGGRRYKTGDFAKAVDTAWDDLIKTEKSMGGPVQASLDNAVENVIPVVSQAKKNLWAEFESRMNFASGPNAYTSHFMVDGFNVAKAMRSKITGTMRIENPGLANRIEAMAAKYDKMMTVRQAESYLQDVNSELNAYYKLNKVDMRAAADNPALGWKVAKANALRDELYATMDKAQANLPRGTAGARDLMQRYSALTKIERETLNRIPQIKGAAPYTLGQQGASILGVGNIIRSIATLDITAAAEGIGEIGIANWLRTRNSPNYLVRSAFRNAGAPAAGTIPKFINTKSMVASRAISEQNEYDWVPGEGLVPRNKDER